MRTQLACLSLVLTGLTMSSSGCILLAAGAGAAGTVAYVKGDLEAEEPQNIDQVYAATKKAAEDLKLYVLRGEGGKDALSATFVARDAGDKRVTVKLKTVAQDVTKLSIRVGTFGDQTKQRLIYGKIRENLKAASPQPAQTPPAAPSEPSAQTPPTTPAAQSPPNEPAAQPSQSPPGPPTSQEPAQMRPDPAVTQQAAQDSSAPPDSQ
jgi:hypothetical protein